MWAEACLEVSEQSKSYLGSGPKRVLVSIRHTADPLFTACLRLTALATGVCRAMKPPLELPLPACVWQVAWAKCGQAGLLIWAAFDWSLQPLIAPSRTGFGDAGALDRSYLMLL